MPLDDPGHFALYLAFVYTNSLPRDDEPLPKDNLEWTSRCDADYMDLARVYALAEKLQDTTTKNAIIHRMFDISERLNGQGHCALPPGKAIQVFYESTTEHSPRRLLPDMWSTVLKEGLFAEANDFPKPFLVKLASVLLDQKRPKAKNIADHAGVEAYLEKERDWE